MFELLFIVIIGVIFFKRIQQAKENDRSTAGRPGQAPALPPANQPSHPGRPAAADHTSQMRRVAQKATKQAAIEEAKQDSNTTTAYLMEKAEADAREHAREKYEEQKRLYETRGGLPVAERHLDGDPVPQGRQCVKCGYCGAENLLPMMPRTRYSCYFCREAL